MARNDRPHSLTMPASRRQKLSLEIFQREVRR